MINNIEVDDLIGVLESIRSDKYAFIPDKLIKDIIKVQIDKQDDRVQARKDTKKLIDEFLRNTTNS
ncbi:hypothetical protein HMPREF1020_00404 [Clostridium sp. 7_3_54FAA]|nr:hypothetical protein HMPREF1020_00404 [Clostridium sp. 7_3_54FAA]DAE70550.1 MAG TPA: hypothetical protein [Caudoviricetes sp.]